MNFYNILKKLSILLIFSSCSSGDLERKNISEGNAHEYGQVSEYFLPLLPQWIDFSVTGQCFRNSEVQYLNFKKLNDSYGYEYEKMIELQSFFNYASLALQESKVTTILEKYALFYESIEKLNAGIKTFDYPDYDRFYLVWIDRMSDAELRVWLENYRESEYMNQGVPVLLSFCLTKNQLTSKVESWNLQEEFPHVFSAESFSIYSQEFNQGPRFFVDLTNIFPKKSEIFLVLKSIYEKEGLKEVFFTQGYKIIPFK